MIIAGLLAGLVIFGLFLAMLGSSPPSLPGGPGR